MTREDIIRMAREAGLWEADISKPLFDFAALVTAAKDAEHQQTLAHQQRSYEREIQLEVEAEREACARVCEEPGWNAANWCAKAIRARTP